MSYYLILSYYLSEKNGLVFSNDEWSILKVSLEGFDNARSGPWGHLRHHLPVRKYAFFSMSFMKSAASLKSKIRNANSAFSVLVCFGFEPPNKLSISYACYKVSCDTPEIDPQGLQWMTLYCLLWKKSVEKNLLKNHATWGKFDSGKARDFFWGC